MTLLLGLLREVQLTKIHDQPVGCRWSGNCLDCYALFPGWSKIGLRLSIAKEMLQVLHLLDTLQLPYETVVTKLDLINPNERKASQKQIRREIVDYCLQGAQYPSESAAWNEMKDFSRLTKHETRNRSKCGIVRRRLFNRWDFGHSMDRFIFRLKYRSDVSRGEPFFLSFKEKRWSCLLEVAVVGNQMQIFTGIASNEHDASFGWSIFCSSQSIRSQWRSKGITQWFVQTAVEIIAHHPKKSSPMKHWRLSTGGDDYRHWSRTAESQMSRHRLSRSLSTCSTFALNSCGKSMILRSLADDPQETFTVHQLELQVASEDGLQIRLLGFKSNVKLFKKKVQLWTKMMINKHKRFHVIVASLQVTWLPRESSERSFF